MYELKVKMCRLLVIVSLVSLVVGAPAARTTPAAADLQAELQSIIGEPGFTEPPHWPASMTDAASYPP